jgi:type VI secretion system ImpM family protein
MIQQPTLPIGMFGKVPSHPDFVRLNAGGTLARSLDQWMQDGLSQMRTRVGKAWELAFDRAQPLFFLYRDKDPSEALVGVCCPGRDRTGRRYPFSIFAYVHLGRGGAGFHVLPAAYARFLKAARRLATTECVGGLDEHSTARIVNLSSTVPQNLLEFRRRLDQYLSDVTMESFWRGLYPDFHDQRKYLVMKNLFSALAPRRGQDAARLSFTLHLPTGIDFDWTAMQSAIWFLLCQAVLGDSALSRSVLFWYADATAPAQGCYLFFNAPSPGSLSYLFAPETDDQALWNMETMGSANNEDTRSRLGEPIVAALDAPQNKMKEFISAVGA